jgi:hypothetical protein
MQVQQCAIHVQEYGMNVCPIEHGIIGVVAAVFDAAIILGSLRHCQMNRKLRTVIK